MVFYGLTDIGQRRKNNQDSFKIHTTKRYLSAVVCDGMGGAKGGNVASSMAVNAYTKSVKSMMAKIKPSVLTESDLERIMLSSAGEANLVVYERATTDSAVEGMGTTLVALLAANDCVVAINVGDSSLFRIFDGKLDKITKDHSLVQLLLDNGTLTQSEAADYPNRNIILRALGVAESVEADSFFIKDFDYLLLCTDGLTNCVPPEKIETVLNSEMTVEEKAERLVADANENGGTDNITAVVLAKDRISERHTI